MATVFERVQNILVDRLGVDHDEVTQDAKIRDDLGADSLDIVEIIMEIEDEFDMEISDADTENLLENGGNVKAIVDHITNHGG